MENKIQQKISSLLEENLPLVDLNSEFLFTELDSLGVATILMVLSEEFGISLEAADATPKNLSSIASLAALVESKTK